MKIAVTATKPERDALLDKRFGRCGFFVIIDTQTDAWEAFPNPAQDASGGAGPQAAEFLASKGAECVISGDFGPNAHSALQAGGISMYKAPEGPVGKLIEEYLGGRLTQVTAPTSKQRHGGGGGRGGGRGR
jgi:predicted Fe-Mo cluster-binding NifX family protein